MVTNSEVCNSGVSYPNFKFIFQPDPTHNIELSYWQHLSTASVWLRYIIKFNPPNFCAWRQGILHWCSCRDLYMFSSNKTTKSGSCTRTRGDPITCTARESHQPKTRGFHHPKRCRACSPFPLQITMGFVWEVI